MCGVFEGGEKVCDCYLGLVIHQEEEQAIQPTLARLRPRAEKLNAALR